MSTPALMLGGVAVHLMAGAPEYAEQPLGGETSVRLSLGALVNMRHWEKMSGSISAAGWMPPGLDGLDYSAPLELRSCKARTQQGAGPAFALSFDPRPDKAPWAFGLLPGNRVVATPCVTAGRVVTVTPVAGALGYQVWAMPVYWVKAARPQESQGASHGWSLSWEEV